jgi:hypothetical protein
VDREDVVMAQPLGDLDLLSGQGAKMTLCLPAS